ncbi:MAG: hypothetical protein Q8N89_12975 [Azonexus sp.]|nr:hypothetical protein [Azonexus sp.]
MKLSTIQDTADFLEDAAHLEAPVAIGSRVFNSGVDANGKEFVMIVHNEGNSDVTYI